MTDRDRLAADLHEHTHDAFCGHDAESCIDSEWWLPVADRLIALGWTRLDEERLARALASWFGAELLNPSKAAHGVAKTYREDDRG